MTQSGTDVVVIGLGPGGGEVATRLLDAGLSVVGVERELVGGECPCWGCIPSKMAVRAAGTLAEARRVPLLAGTVDVRPDFGAVARRIRAEATDDWDDSVAVARFEKVGGRYLRGTAVIERPGQVRVGDEVVTARRGVVVATGSAPVRPPIPGLAESGYWTNREAIAAKEAPDSLVVLGGGAIGLELAQAFAGSAAPSPSSRVRTECCRWRNPSRGCGRSAMSPGGAFTHLAVHQAGIAVADILGTPGPPADYTALPRVTFTDPEVGSVGRTEAVARAAGLPVAVGTAPVAASSRGFVHGPGNDGLIKLVVDTDRDLLVGATAVGPAGGEVLGLMALAIHARVPVATLDSMILAYPTFTRGVRDALIDLRS
jgi:pyruvate/2-oxoglutarate dehydrogenase complex dihydrolipoamide dehydrogenase (E3) component